MKSSLLQALSIFILAATIPAATQAGETTNGGYTGCVSEAYYDQMMQAVVRKDNRGFKFLIENNRCFTLPAGLSFSMLDRGFTQSHIRIYVGDQSIELYVPSEMIR